MMGGLDEGAHLTKKAGNHCYEQPVIFYSLRFLHQCVQCIHPLEILRKNFHSSRIWANRLWGLQLWYPAENLRFSLAMSWPSPSEMASSRAFDQLDDRWGRYFTIFLSFWLESWREVEVRPPCLLWGRHGCLMNWNEKRAKRKVFG